jgi:hypothetical protein
MLISPGLISSIGKTLSTILDNDHTFIGRYLEDQFTRKEHLIRHDDSRDYSFIWLRNDYVDIMQRVTSIEKSIFVVVESPQLQKIKIAYNHFYQI